MQCVSCEKAVIVIHFICTDQALAKVKMPPSSAEMEAMKDKLVKMEFDHIAVTTSHEKE